jgi:hypothetical protein
MKNYLIIDIGTRPSKLLETYTSSGKRGDAEWRAIELHDGDNIPVAIELTDEIIRVVVSSWSRSPTPSQGIESKIDFHEPTGGDDKQMMHSE